MFSFVALPYEIRELIVLELASDLDGVHDLASLFRVSKAFHDSLLGAPHYDRLYFPLLNAMFDDAAPRRRLPLLPDLATYASVFKYRCQLLRHIRRSTTGAFSPSPSFTSNDNHPDALLRGLWEIYLMLLDDDGNNIRQLDAANVKNFLLHQLLTRIERDLDQDGWPLETTHLQLAAASFAILSDRADALKEPLELTERIYNALEQLYVASHRYPHTQLPVTVFHEHHLRNVPSVHSSSLRTMATLPFFGPSSLVYFGSRLSIAPPSLACSATLILTNRRERLPIGTLPNRPVPPVLQEMNAFRAIALGTEVPRAKSGREHFSGLSHCFSGSRRWDHAFARMCAVGALLDRNSLASVNTWFETMYYRGMFSGRWLGRIMLPDVRFMIQMTAMHPASFSQVRESLHEDLQHIWNADFYAELREHENCDEPVGCGLAQIDAGYRNAYFPDGVDPIAGLNFSEKNGRVAIADPNEPDPKYQTKHYLTLTEERIASSSSSSQYFREIPLLSSTTTINMDLSEDSADASNMEMDRYDDSDDSFAIPDEIESEFAREGVGINVDSDPVPFDVVITGETDEMHRPASGDYRFYGRVRKLDGLVVLVRACPSDPDQGRWVFAGNMHLANTIVGLCRQSSTDIGATTLQGPFIISKIGREFYHPEPEPDPRIS